MISCSNGTLILEPSDSLPALVGSDVFLDFETTSGDPKKTSLNPWHDCWIAGVAVTVDDMPHAYYVPIGHHDAEGNLPYLDVYNWIIALLSQCKRWINHNVKYDAQVLTNNTGWEVTCPIIDTVTLAKIVDSDRYQYSLDKLAADWLHEDISAYELAMAPYLRGNSDYGAIPIDKMGEYAGQDVLTNRRLWRYIDARIPDQCREVANTEIKLTSSLYRMERVGLCVEPLELAANEFTATNKMLQLEEELSQLVGFHFRPHTNEDCFDVLCNTYGLPVLSYNESGNPSFDKEALSQYMAHPLAPKPVVEKILQFRKLNTLCTLFLNPWQELHVDGVLHPSFNQAVRTGRMSCRQPNAQQLSAFVKTLVHPHKGMCYLSVDYSQIEFRLIAHYINDRNAIAAYAQDPDTDFHQWVADMCEVNRKPAKTINFLMGYGGGKKKLLSALVQIMELVGDLYERAKQLSPNDPAHLFNRLALQRALNVYDTYHARLPGIKLTSRRVAAVAAARGYVFNLYGRHRHLPRERAHIAFNTVNQSSAADLMKERTVALDDHLRGTPIRIVASVHDETLMEMPVELASDVRVIASIVKVLESPACDLRVPIRCQAGVGLRSWGEASKSGRSITSEELANATVDHIR